MQILLLTLQIAALLATGVRTDRSLSSRVQSSSSQTTGLQKILTMSQGHEVTMTLAGTTPIHDWTMTAHGIRGVAEAEFSSDRQLTNIASLTFRLPVRNLKGEQEAMNRDCYAALKADRFPEILFALSSATIEQHSKTRYTVHAKGNLSVAGVTRMISMTMEATVGQEGAIRFTGSEGLRMSDYGVERPSLLFGAIKAGDAMTLTYNLIFNEQPPCTQP